MVGSKLEALAKKYNTTSEGEQSAKSMGRDAAYLQQKKTAENMATMQAVTSGIQAVQNDILTSALESSISQQNKQIAELEANLTPEKKIAAQNQLTDAMDQEEQARSYAWSFDESSSGWKKAQEKLSLAQQNTKRVQELLAQQKADAAELEELKRDKYFTEASLSSLSLDSDLRARVDKVPELKASIGQTANLIGPGSRQDASQYTAAGQELAQLESDLAKKGLDSSQTERLFDVSQRKYNEEKTKQAISSLEEFADTNWFTGLFSTIASTGLSLASGIGYLDQAVSKALNPDVPSDYYSPAMAPYYYNQAIRGTVAENIRQGWSGDVGAFLYNTGTSMLDSGATMAITAATGLPAYHLLGGAAATAAMMDAKQRGGSDSQAITLGLLSGVAESAFEKISIEHFLSLERPETARALIKNAMLQGGVEASEEINTTIANTISDALVMRDKSQFNLDVQKYMEAGYSKEDAMKKAAMDTVQQIGLDALGGFLSGGLFGGFQGGFQMATQNRSTGQQLLDYKLKPSDVQAFIDEGLATDPNSKARQLAQKAQEKVNQGGTLSPTELGRLYRANVAAVDSTADVVEQGAVETETVPQGRPETRQETARDLGQMVRDRLPEIEAAMAEKFRELDAGENPALRDNLNAFEQTTNPVDNQRESAYTEILARGDARVGSSGETYTDGNTPVRFTYAIVPAESLRTSNDQYGNINPLYPSELQPRDRSRENSQMQIQAISQNLNPILLAESPTAQNGAPIIREDGAVVGGNARAQAIISAYESGKAGAYESFLRENGTRYGIDTDALPEHPVLVRVANGVSDWAALGRDLNASTTSNYSASEQGMSDAQKIGSILEFLVPDENGNINNRDNREFISRFISEVVPDSERNSTATKDGLLSQAGLERVQNAIFAYAYEDTGLLQRLSESLDNDAKNVTGALLATASAAANTKNGERNGTLYNYQMVDTVKEAVQLYLESKQQGKTVTEVSQQTSMFGEYSDPAVFLAEYIESNKRSTKKIRGLLNALYEEVALQGDPNQTSLFGEDQKADVQEIFERATGRVDPGKNVPTFRTGRSAGDGGLGAASGSGGGTVANSQYYGESGAEVPGAVESGSGTGERAELNPALRDNLAAFERTLEQGRGSDAMPAMGAADAGFADSPYNRWVYDAEQFHRPGEKAVRNPSLPTQNLEGRNTMKTGQTIMEAEATPDSRVEEVETMFVDGALSYVPQVDANLAQEAEGTIRQRGWDTALTDWTAAVRAGKVNAKLVAMGAQLLNNMGNSNASTSQYAELVADYSNLLHNAGQSLQAARILKTLTPEGRLYALQRSVEDINSQIKRDTGIELDQGLIDEYRNAQTDEERDAILDRMKQDVADKIPSTLQDKWTALRYVNMLGNLKTQGRNILGNTGMSALRAAKDRVGASIEALAHKVSGGKFERTMSATVGKAWMDAAKADFSNVEGELRSDGKFQDSPLSRTRLLSDIENRRTIFKNSGTWGTNADSSTVAKGARKATDAAWSVLEGYRKVTNFATSEGDVVFMKHHYARALAGYLKANGVEVSQFLEGNVDQALLDRARNYAIREAKEATFHDNNVFSDWVSRIGRRSDTPKAARVIAEGLAPFRKTPANILWTGAKYSPLGLIDTVVTTAQAMQGDATASDVINSLSKSLTGTGLLLLGMALSKGGFLKVKSDDDDQRIDGLMNRQDYSLVLGDQSYTMDWLSPAMLPVFMGGILQETLEDQELTWKDVDSVVGRFTDPILNTSMLSGLDDAIRTIKFSDNGLLQLAATFSLSYLSQGLTNTLLGQAERTSEDTRMTTYVDPDSAVPEWVQRYLGSMSAKIPGWDYQQTEYLDEFGQTEGNGDLWARGAENFLSPWYTATSHENEPLYAELQKLHDATGEDAFPDASPPKTLNYQDNKYTLSPEERQTYQKTYGQTAKEIMQSLIDTEAYESMTAEQKALLLEDAISLANDIAKAEALSGQGVDYTSPTWDKAFQAYEHGASFREYLTHRSILNASKQEDRATQAENFAALEQMDAATETKAVLWDLQEDPKKLGENPKNPYNGALAKAGVSEDKIFKVMEKYKELQAGEGSAKQMVNEFSGFLAELGLSVEQREVADETYGFGMYIPLSPDAYSYNTMSDSQRAAWDNWGKDNYSMEDYLRLWRVMQSKDEDGKTVKKDAAIELLAEEIGYVNADQFYSNTHKQYKASAD